MTLDEAIRRLSGRIDLITKDKDYPTECALKLGIEALKRIKNNRTADFPLDYSPLPGEANNE